MRNHKMAIMGMSVHMAYNWYSNMYRSTTAFKRCVSPGKHNDLRVIVR